MLASSTAITVHSSPTPPITLQYPSSFNGLVQHQPPRSTKPIQVYLNQDNPGTDNQPRLPDKLRHLQNIPTPFIEVGTHS